MPKRKNQKADKKSRSDKKQKPNPRASDHATKVELLPAIKIEPKIR